MKTNKDNCVNCHACITVCPVKFCNNGITDWVDVDEKLCIDCNKCRSRCTHDARYFEDDIDYLFKNLDTLNVAPSVIANFDYKKLFGFLKKEFGVKEFWNASVGAEVITAEYLRKLKGVSGLRISSACPVIVKLIETNMRKYVTNLVEVDSPLMATHKMIGRKNTVALTPCIKKGYEGYKNITFEKLEKYIVDNNINIDRYEEVDFTVKGSIGSLFPNPGGLKENILIENPKIKNVEIVKIEGADRVIEFLENYREDNSKLIVLDCLNCDGCSVGTGCVDGNKNKTIDKVSIKVEKTKKSKISKKYNVNLGRSFKPVFKNFNITEAQKNTIFQEMKKRIEHNCSACGYGSCKNMAIAISKGLNKKENCFQYMKKVDEEHTIKINEQKLEIEKEYKLVDKEREDKANLLEYFSGSVQEISANLHELVSQNKMIYEKTKNTKKSSSNAVIYIKDYRTIKNEASKHIKNLERIEEGIIKISNKINMLAINTGIEVARLRESNGLEAIVEHITALSSNIKNEIREASELVLKIEDADSKSEDNINLVEKEFLEVNDILEEITIGYRENTDAIENIQSELEGLNKLL